MSQQLTMSSEVVEAIALRVVELLEVDGLRASSPAALMTAAEVAAGFGVTRAWVYEHATELAAVRLGTGPKARLRFDPKVVAKALASCSASRESQVPVSTVAKPHSAKTPRRRMGTRSDLLPIRGLDDPKSASDPPSERSAGEPAVATGLDRNQKDHNG